MIENFGNKRNTAGFDKNPQNINSDGRPNVSITGKLRELASKEGKLLIPKDCIKQTSKTVQIQKNGEVQEVEAVELHLTALDKMLLMWWNDSTSGNSRVRARARETLLDRLEGKAKQQVEFESINTEAIKITYSDMNKIK